ncbi:MULTISPECIES: cardiolipin synthase [Comamonas]|uniref:Cardiolipin synthase n=1 Tax=Comamonas testosteroni TaxID=285 RepID=A0A096F6U6_COMTE|nr:MULTISPECIES: cardiolipin synthase [Comamonas]KGH26026.1 cardiolipin synthase [Comamonas testosteroni]MPT11907.1 cardiolipin synthase [Comamonas sp.]
MTWLLLTLHVLLIAGFGLRILLRRDMRPDVRLAWLMVIVLLPYVSCLLYYLFGEVALGRVPGRRRLNVREFCQSRSSAATDAGRSPQALPAIPDQWLPAFRYASSINGFVPLPGHRAELMRDGAHARAQMLADMDAAHHEINVLYYIWLDDRTGTDMAHALMRAAQRGVTCRAMVDGLGSRALTRSPLWQQMQQAGVHLAIALPISNLLKVMLTSRIDLRNHRKITLIDGRINYCGSQNCADEGFHIKARYAPWVDIMLRLQGPVATQMQQAFASDWAQSDASLEPPATEAEAGAAADDGFHAVAIAEGPTERARSTPQLVASLLACAQREVVISTPYFVPDSTVLDALCAAALRQVQVTLILPARNDSWIVGAVSRSHYWRLLSAGVHIHEFRPGLLHAKTLCLDGSVSLIGSTNLDLRSFDLNFENNVLLHDEATTEAIRQRQQSYLRDSDAVTLEQVRATRWWKRIWDNLLGALSPLL